MGPQASKSYPGRRLVKPAGPRAERAKQEIDYGRRDVAGYVFGALQPASGAALTATYTGRTLANWVDFLGKVERWIDPTIERVYAVMDNLNTHTAMDVLLFALALVNVFWDDPTVGFAKPTFFAAVTVPVQPSPAAPLVATTATMTATIPDTAPEHVCLVVSVSHAQDKWCIR